MPIGEREWAGSKGPRKKLALRVSAEAHILLAVAGTMTGASTAAMATEVTGRWAEEWLRENLDAIREERERRTDA